MTASTALAELLQPFNNITNASNSIPNSQAHAVKFTLPLAGVSYKINSIFVTCRGFAATFPQGTNVKLHLLDNNGQPAFVGNDVDLSGTSAALHAMEFPLQNRFATDAFYAAIQSTGSATFEFAVAYDQPSGRNFGASYIYVPSTGGLNVGAQDWLIWADVSGPSPADFNSDGTVDAADYVVWRKTGINGPTGYDTWRTHFGEPAAGGSGASVNATIPEPTTAVMLMLAVAGWCLRRGRAA